MEGVGGKPAWYILLTSARINIIYGCTYRSWIFILEGLVTVIAGAASFFIIQDFPDDARFLTEAERAFVIRRLQADDQFSAGGETLKWKYIWQSIFDIKTWLGSKLRAMLFYPEL